MADPFDITTARQRRIVLAAVAVYAVLFVVQILTGHPLAEAGADLLLAALVVPVSLYAIRQATDQSDTDWLSVATGNAFLIAGLTIGYEGLATLGWVPESDAVSTLSLVSLLVAFALYLYQRSQPSR